MTSTDPRPSAFITLGGAGSGKSTLSKRLAEVSGAVYLDKDTLAGPLVQLVLEALGQDPHERETNRMYLDRVMPVEYDTLFAVARSNLELGRSVVLDAPFVAYLGDADYLAEAAERAGWPQARIRVVHVRTSSETVRQRLVARGLERDRAKLADWATYWQRFGSRSCAWTTGEHSTVDNDGDDAEAQLIRLLDAPPTSSDRFPS